MYLSDFPHYWYFHDPLSSTRKLRHPMERRTALYRWAILVLTLCNDNRAWRKHPEPFAKTCRGRLRRIERKFVTSFDGDFQ